MQKTRIPTRVLFTGGHAGSTALATIQKLRETHNCEIFFIGGQSSLEGKKSRTMAQVAFSGMGVKVYNLVTGRLQTKMTLWTLPSLFKIPLGFVQAFYLVARIRPTVTVSFGGYAALPVVIVSWIFRIPVIIHEQTSVAGRANRISAVFASKIALARESSAIYFAKNKCVVTGNPIPEGVVYSPPKKIHTPVRLLVTGGFSGSTAINSLIKTSLPKLLEKYEIVHQTGDWQFQKFSKLQASLSESQKKRYKVFSVIKPSEWGRYLEWADIFISRSGANFTYQLLIIKKPAILIPLPIAYLNEQKINAIYASDYGLAKVLEQKNASADVLMSLLDEIVENWGKIVKTVADKKSPDLAASGKLVDLISSYISFRS